MATERAYCLYETVAPAGFTAASIDNPVLIKPGTTAETKITAVNTQKEGPELPLTGAAGTILLIIGGLGVIALAAGAHVVVRNRQAQKA